MKKNLLFILGLFLAVSFIACDKDDDDERNDISERDRAFARQVAQINLGEIEGGEIAVDRAWDNEVELYGSMMITDHTQAQRELDSITRNLSIALPNETDQKHKDMANMLRTIPEEEFDSTYIHKMIEGHEEAINLFQDQLNNGDNQHIRSYAAKYIDIIREHRDRAITIANNLNAERF